MAVVFPELVKGEKPGDDYFQELLVHGEPLRSERVKRSEKCSLGKPLPLKPKQAVLKKI